MPITSSSFVFLRDIKWLIKNSQARIPYRARRPSCTARPLPEIDAKVKVSCLESNDTFLGSVIDVRSGIKSATTDQAASGHILLTNSPEQVFSLPQPLENEHASSPTV